MVIYLDDLKKDSEEPRENSFLEKSLINTLEDIIKKHLKVEAKKKFDCEEYIEINLKFDNDIISSTKIFLLK